MTRSFAGFGDGRRAPGPEPAASPNAVPDGPGSATPEARLALLIGNGRYGVRTLANPVPDVRLIGGALRQLGFAVTRVEDADLAAMRSAIAEFAGLLAQHGPGSVALVYFAGHGIQWEGINYLIPTGTEIPTQRFLAVRALSLDEVVASLARDPRRANIVILDACRDNPLARDAAGVTGGLAALGLPPQGMLVAYSTAAGAVAFDGAAGHSPYATALVECLPALLEPGRRVHDVFVETADRVRAATLGAQTPALFLQGGLPPLTLNPEDEARRAAYDPFAPARTRRTVLRTIAAVVLLAMIGTGMAAWMSLYPEVRQGWLARAGLAAPVGAGLGCDGPPGTAAKDAFGLTAADWCGLDPVDLDRIAHGQTGLADAVGRGAAAGDPKALFLRASAQLGVTATLPGAVVQAVQSDLARAAASGLPVAAFLHETLAAAGLFVPDRAMLDRAADRGHVLSRIQLAVLAGESGQTDLAAQALEGLRRQDRTGFASYQLARLYGGILSDRFGVDLPRSDDLMRDAAAQGYEPAIAARFKARDLGLAEISAADEEMYRARQFALGLPEGYWWKIKALQARGLPADLTRAMELAHSLQTGTDDADAGLVFASLAVLGAGAAPVAADALAAALDLGVRKQRAGAMVLRAQLRMGLYKDARHQPLLPIDPAGARRDLEAALALSGDDRVALLLARFHLLGVGGTPDAAAAAPYLAQAQASKTRATARDAQALAAAGVRAGRLANDSAPWDTARGAPDAPVTVIVYLDPACPACQSDSRADIFETWSLPCMGCGVTGLDPVLRWLDATYVKTGFVRLLLRPVVAADGSVDGLLRLSCRDPSDRFQDMLDAISGKAPVPSPVLAAPCAAAADRAAAAARNTERLRLVTADLIDDARPVAPNDLPEHAERGLSDLPAPASLPVAVVNGWLLADIIQPEMEEAIYLQLSPARQLAARRIGGAGCPPPLPDAGATGAVFDPGFGVFCAAP